MTRLHADRWRQSLARLEVDPQQVLDIGLVAIIATETPGVRMGDIANSVPTYAFSPQFS